MILHAYCWGDGSIGFGLKVPEGALSFARHTDGQLLRDVVRRHASDCGIFIVSVRMAEMGMTDDDPVDCLLEFGNYIHRILDNEKS